MLADAFVILFAAHLLADYPLQTDHQAAHKAAAGLHGWIANLAHGATHVAVSLVLLVLVWHPVANLDLDPSALALALIWLGTSHSVIDRRWPVAWWMNHARQASFAAHGGTAHVDQAAHIAFGILPAAAILAAF